MLTNLYLVRHAHSTYSPDELGRPLSQRGFIDAEKIMKLFENKEIDIIISSPYKRAIQTVEGIANFREKVVLLEENFKERTLSIGAVEDFEAAITKVWVEPTFSWSGGESNMDAQKRGVKALKNLLTTCEGKNVVIGTHGNLMTLILNHFDKNYDFNFWKTLDMPDIYKLTFEYQELKEVKRIWNRTENIYKEIYIHGIL
ncbi:histidine phosphatase family protein [Ureibacillus chungkukjangi]|uniref:histidine phosphatase family protein n=1 Tax=Ureibacillus chungkukjangi TaxID=1202712 RepID=UPI00203F53A6|nr:histidine phosphatase family protein [Ureibacillus chungkukjangi]MCM3388325.1 histidine phosphatase family protein [Ureibacillus chungkukjangi]